MKARVNARWQNQESKYGFAGTVTEEDTTSNYLRGYNDENLPRFTAGVNVVGKFELFGRSHDVFVGVNYENFIDSKKFISAYYLVKFGNPSTVEDFEVPYANLDRTKMKICQGGVYAQLRLALLNNLLVNVGGRISSVCASMYDFERLDWVEAVKEECRITPLLGIAYDPVSYLTLYASYSTLFVPQTEKKDDGSILKPRIGYQVELGFKSGFCDNHITANMALFYLQDKDRAYKVSPKPTYVNAGKVENKGVEMELNAFPCKGLELAVGYTYLNTEIVKSADGDEGLAFSPIEPEHSFKLFVAYYMNGVLRGLAFGVNTQVFSESYASVLTPERNQKAYMLLNGFVSYRVNKHISLYLNGNNITDCVYYSRLGGNGDFWGDPCNFTLCMRCDF